MTDKTPAKTATRSKKKPATDWAALAGRSATAPKEEIEREEARTTEPAAQKQVSAGVQTTASGKVVPVTKAQTFRLPLDAHQIIAEAKADEAANGNKLTNDAAVTEALRMWGKARQRRKS